MLPTAAKRFSVTLIPKLGKLHGRRLIPLLDDLEAFVTVHISKNLPNGLETVDTLPPYITTYRKGKSIDDITIVQLPILEDIN